MFFVKLYDSSVSLFKRRIYDAMDQVDLSSCFASLFFVNTIGRFGVYFFDDIAGIKSHYG